MRWRAPVDMLREQGKGRVKFASDAAAAQPEAEACACYQGWILAVCVLVDLSHAGFAVPQGDRLQITGDKIYTLSTRSAADSGRQLIKGTELKQ